MRPDEAQVLQQESRDQTPPRRREISNVLNPPYGSDKKKQKKTSNHCRTMTLVVAWLQHSAMFRYSIKTNLWALQDCLTKKTDNVLHRIYATSTDRWFGHSQVSKNLVAMRTLDHHDTQAV